MIRLLIFILAAVFVAYIATFLASLEGEFSAVVFGQNIWMPVGVLLGGLLAAATALMIGTSLVNHLAGMPQRMRARKEKRQTSRGLAALTRGLESVAVGDGADALHHARVARRNLGDGSLTRLLTAQAAQISGDEAAAGANFQAMLEAPETEFLGLKGLYEKALREGEEDAARGYAERAFRLRPNATWAFKSVFDLALERGAWGEARATLTPALKNRLIDQAALKRGEAALLTAAAYAADASDDQAGALEEAEAALKTDPGFAPAACLDAQLHEAAGRRQRAVKALEQAFAVAPCHALLAALERLTAQDSAADRADALRHFAKRNPDDREARLAEAKAHSLAAEYDEAIAILEPLLEKAASAHECALMGEAVGGAHGETGARPWLERAANVPRDPAPGSDGRFNLTREGWARLVREYMANGRLAPPPLEGPPPGLPASEIKLLAKPVAAIAPPETTSIGLAAPDASTDEKPNREGSADVAAAKVDEASQKAADASTADSKKPESKKAAAEAADDGKETSVVGAPANDRASNKDEKATSPTADGDANAEASAEASDLASDLASDEDAARRDAAGKA